MEPIRVIYHEEEGSWWAESPDVPRWTAGASSFDEVRKLAEEGVRFALERDDVEIEHFVPEASTPKHAAPARSGSAA